MTRHWHEQGQPLSVIESGRGRRWRVTDTHRVGVDDASQCVLESTVGVDPHLCLVRPHQQHVQPLLADRHVRRPQRRAAVVARRRVRHERVARAVARVPLDAASAGVGEDDAPPVDANAGGHRHLGTAVRRCQLAVDVVAAQRESVGHPDARRIALQSDVRRGAVTQLPRQAAGVKQVDAVGGRRRHRHKTLALVVAYRHAVRLILKQRQQRSLKDAMPRFVNVNLS